MNWFATMRVPAEPASACQLMRQLGYRQVINGASVGAVALKKLNRPIERA